MPAYSLTANVEVNQALNPKEHAAGAITGTEVDANGFDRAMFLVNVGDISTGGGIKFEVKQAATTGGTFATITSTGSTELLDTVGDNKCIIIDIPVANATPFLKLTGTAGTAAALAGATCIIYNGNGLRPPTQGATESIVL